MSNPADDYYDKKQQALLVAQSAKEQAYPEMVKKAKEFQEMKDAHYWYYERAW